MTRNGYSGPDSTQQQGRKGLSKRIAERGHLVVVGKIVKVDDGDRFWIRVDKDGPDGCWVWGGRKNSGGYGMFRITRKNEQAAHRYAYEQLVGPIPEGLVLDHLCRNTLCVNPEHLEAVTQQVNIERGQGYSARNARKTHCPQGHPYDEENTVRYCWRTLPSGSKCVERKCRICQARHQAKQNEKKRLTRYVRKATLEDLKRDAGESR